eukprot:Pgem_evm1s10780
MNDKTINIKRTRVLRKLIVNAAIHELYTNTGTLFFDYCKLAKRNNHNVKTMFHCYYNSELQSALKDYFWNNN